MAAGITRATSGSLSSGGSGVGTSVNDIDVLMPKFIAPARFYYEQGFVMKGNVTTYSFPHGQGQTFYLPKFARGTAYHLEEGVPINQSQKLSASNAMTIVPGESGIQIVLSKRAASMAKEDLMRAAGKIAGNAMAVLEDKDLLTLFAGLSNYSVAGSGVTLTSGHIMAARAILSGNSGGATNEPAPLPYAAVLHDWQYHSLAEELAVLSSGSSSFPTSGGGMADEVLRNYLVDVVAGVKVFHDNNITITSNNATGAIFSKEAFAYVEFEGMETTKVYDEDLRAWKINTLVDYGFGEYQDRWGVKCISDATQPTS